MSLSIHIKNCITINRYLQLPL
jgi:hypothetical protein